MLAFLADPVFVASQVLMLVAASIVFLSFQFRDGKTFRWFFVVGGLFAGAHFLLLGATTATFVVFINSARWLVSIFSKSRSFLYVFIALIVVSSIGTFENVYSLIPLSAGVIGTVAIFHHNELRTREILLVVSLLWLVYNAIIMSPMGVVAEILFFSSAVVGYLKLKKTEASA